MIPFLDLKKINKPYGNCFSGKTEINFLDNGRYVLGNEVKEFETNFANYCGAKTLHGVVNT